MYAFNSVNTHTYIHNVNFLLINNEKIHIKNTTNVERVLGGRDMSDFLKFIF